MMPLNSCKSHKSEIVENDSTISQPLSQKMEPNHSKRTSRTLIIMYNAETGEAPLLEAAKKYGAEIIYRYENFSGVALVIPDGKDVNEAIRYFRAVKGVTAVNRNNTVRPL